MWVKKKGHSFRKDSLAGGELDNLTLLNICTDLWPGVVNVHLRCALHLASIKTNTVFHRVCSIQHKMKWKDPLNGSIQMRQGLNAMHEGVSEGKKALKWVLFHYVQWVFFKSFFFFLSCNIVHPRKCNLLWSDTLL